MNISEVAEKFDMTPATIRYYEKQGLIPPITRNSVGVRDFEEEDISWVEFIKCMRDSGLSIDSLAKYSELYQQGSATLIERKKILIDEYQKLLEKQKLINGTVARLEAKLENYDQMIQECEQQIFSNSKEAVSEKVLKEV
ncbi:MerR family transcriptional regulator [Enterococcus raffinosus]|uniref:MerR family transcriptional regulator n=1 Tax=Enterococcus raffinosus TaxID=71452 RepID=A0AAW8TA30_9ENTE|nr:MerR family transcriptional regulator [Enterococcus raffinosus]MDT2524331.1 MerR family transcriptional regulator [Enterococcus raffinosus]MDT2535264.1 MerR family transcriptional regulator [Enterococcus raffinosus]MDT2545184.1 MerR family transcriptional regulator [Enterococcus raffinosus]MDT2578729.1 MerR family transcriptional regulator [Enterococcus raffinosus]MDT2591794.1 MerR family transcriptional regulator [Enterococcus raffinosus]